MQKAEKQEFVKNFNETLKDKDFLVVAHYKGLSVSEISSLRQKIKSANSIFKVAKNTLAKKALKDTNFEVLDKLFVGPTSVAYSDDPVSTSKVLIDFAKENENLKILGGIMGSDVLDVAGVKNVATLPTLDEARAKIVGILRSPAQKIASILLAPASKIAILALEKSKK